MRNFILLFFFLIFGIQSKAQNDTSTINSIDTTHSTKANSTLRNIFTGKPGKAFALSLLIPGGGQIYNKRWWKLPLVYGAFGYTFYLINFNTKQYKRYDSAYRMRIDLKDNSKDEFQGILSTDAINSNRKYIDKNLQRSYLAAVGVYLLSGIEAFVDRHFMEFDVSEDIGLQWNPSIIYNSPGVSICLNFR
ncbi:MAG: DUF5683 domain-containing protein [Saprospiraceae bacterium]